MTKLTYPTLLVAMLSALQVAYAADSDTTTTSEVRVTASRVERELLDVNMSVSVITAKDIEDSGAQTIADLLKDVPGVEMNTDGSQGMKRILIRGENAFRTLIMIDGQRMTEQKSMSGTPILIDPSQIERIEVIKGPASVLFGADALGGAINIITKKGGKKPVEGTVSAGYNSSNRGGSASASIAGAAGGFHYRLGAAYEGGRDLKLAHGKAPGTDFESKSANAYLAYDVSDTHTIGLVADHFDLDFNSSTPTMSADDFYVHVPSWKRTKVGIFDEVHYLTDTLTKLRTDLFYQKSNKVMTNHVNVDQGMVSVTNDNTADNTLKQLGASVQADWTFTDRLYVITGYDVSYEMLDATSVSNTNLSMRGRGFNTFTTWNYEGNLLTQALYASADYQLTPTLTLNGGARYTHVRTDMERADGTKVTSGVSAPVSSTTGKETNSRVVFNAGLIWRPTNPVSVRLAWTQGFRTPLLQERFIDTTMGQAGSVLEGNPNLKPETSNNFEFGVRWVPGNATFDASIFYNRASDYITSMLISSSRSGSVYRYDNVAKAHTVGLELAGSYRIGTTGFEPHVSLTALRRTFEQDGISTSDTGTPGLRVTYGVKWSGDTTWGRTSADLFARSATKADSYSFSTGATEHYDGWTTLNFTAGLDFGPSKNYSLNVGLYNLTNTDYVTPMSLYEAGRYGEVKFTARF